MSTYSGPNQVIISGGKGIISEEDFKGYWDAVMDAFAIHINKEAIRRGLWKDYPAEDQINQISIKADRSKRTLEHLRDSERSPEMRKILIGNTQEELLDIINYCTFALRQLPND